MFAREIAQPEGGIIFVFNRLFNCFDNNSTCGQWISSVLYSRFLVRFDSDYKLSGQKASTYTQSKNMRKTYNCLKRITFCFNVWSYNIK